MYDTKFLFIKYLFKNNEENNKLIKVNQRQYKNGTREKINRK